MSHHPALMGRSRGSKVARGRTRGVGAVASAGDTFLAPYHLDVVPWGSWSASGTTPARGNATTFLSMGALGQDPADADSGDYIEWSATLGAGTYTCTIIGTTYLDYGSWDYTLDGAALGTKDWYSAGVVYNVAVQFTGIAVTAGVHTFRATANGKNASAVDYRAAHQWFTFTRTGA